MPISLAADACTSWCPASFAGRAGPGVGDAGFLHRFLDRLLQPPGIADRVADPELERDLLVEVGLRDTVTRDARIDLEIERARLYLPAVNRAVYLPGATIGPPPPPFGAFGAHGPG